MRAWPAEELTIDRLARETRRMADAIGAGHAETDRALAPLLVDLAGQLGAESRKAGNRAMALQAVEAAREVTMIAERMTPLTLRKAAAVILRYTPDVPQDHQGAYIAAGGTAQCAAYVMTAAAHAGDDKDLHAQAGVLLLEFALRQDYARNRVNLLHAAKDCLTVAIDGNEDLGTQAVGAFMLLAPRQGLAHERMKVAHDIVTYLKKPILPAQATQTENICSQDTAPPPEQAALILPLPDRPPTDPMPPLLPMPVAV